MAKALKAIQNFVLGKVDTQKIVYKSLAETSLEEVDKELIRAQSFSKAESVVKDVQLKKVQQELADLKKKRNLEQSSLQSDLIDLSKQEKAIQANFFQGSFSLKWIFKQINKGNKIKVTTYDLSTKFGNLSDIGFLKNGQVAIIIEDDLGNTKPLIWGNMITDIFTYPDGMRNTVSRGLLPVNMREDGKHHFNPLAVRVPRTIITAEGKFSRTNFENVTAIEEIDKLTANVLSLMDKNSRLEKALAAQSDSIRYKELSAQIQKENADQASTTLVEAVKTGQEEKKVMYSLLKENHMLDWQKTVQEEINGKVEEVNDKLLMKIRNVLGETDAELARENFEQAIEWFQDVGGRQIREASMIAIQNGIEQALAVQRNSSQQQLPPPSQTNKVV